LESDAAAIREFPTVVRGPARATDNALLRRDTSEFDVAKLDTVRAATERTIALAKERLAALIAGTITGQLDVMGCAA
jgi:limonene-1,2-epoxide hydrolase